MSCLVAKRSGGARSYGSAAGSPRLPPRLHKRSRVVSSKLPRIADGRSSHGDGGGSSCSQLAWVPRAGRSRGVHHGRRRAGAATFTLVADAAAFGAYAYLLGGEIAKKAGAGVDRLPARTRGARRMRGRVVRPGI